MATEDEKFQGLLDFFEDSFTASELEMFLKLNGYREVASAASPSVGGSEYFFNVAQALNRRGRINAKFFDCLSRVRPEKETLIRGLQESWLAEEKSTPKSSGSTTSRGESLRSVDHSKDPRSRLLKEIRKICIENGLKKTLYHGIRIPLHLAERHDAVVHGHDEFFRLGIDDEQPPPKTSIVLVYDQQSRGLLILGGPGSGKTTLLLELLKELLDRAEEDPERPIPVYLRLSSWGASRLPLKNWLVEQIADIYGFNRDTVIKWVKNNQILPLLDGLDDVKKGIGKECIEKIEAFWKEHHELPLATSSLDDAYKALGWKFGLEKAVFVNKLSREQVLLYLNELAATGANLSPILDSDPTLLDLLDNPMYLDTFARTFGVVSGPSALEAGTLENRRDQLAEKYVDAALKRGWDAYRIRRDAKKSALKKKKGEDDSRELPFTREKTLHWLKWLARRLANHDQVFYLDHLQPGWLADPYRAFFTPGVCLLSWVIVAVTLTLPCSLLYGPRMGLIVAVGAGLSTILIAPTIDKFSRDSYEDIVCAEVRGRRWEDAWKNMRARMSRRIRSAAALGLAVGLYQGYTLGFQREARTAAVAGTVWASSFFFVSWLLLGLFDLMQGGLRYRVMIKRVKPNQGIWESLRNAVFIAVRNTGISLLLYIWIFKSLSLLPYLASPESSDASGSGLEPIFAFCLTIGLVEWFRNGGTAVVKHIVVRTLLRCSGDAPWRFVGFLNFARECTLLDKAGNGFAFKNRLLWDHFKGRGNLNSKSE